MAAAMPNIRNTKKITDDIMPFIPQVKGCVNVNYDAVKTRHPAIHHVATAPSWEFPSNLSPCPGLPAPFSSHDPPNRPFYQLLADLGVSCSPAQQGSKVRSFSCPGKDLLWIKLPEAISGGIPSGKALQVSLPTRPCRWRQKRQSCHLLMTSERKGSAKFLKVVRSLCLWV